MVKLILNIWRHTFKIYIYTNSRPITNENKIELGKPEYREFKISEVFEMKNCKPYHSKDIVVTDREGIPYITRTSFNNGLSSFVKKENFKINNENTISYGAENCKFFFQPKKYITGNKMYTLYNKNMNKYNSLYLVTLLNKMAKDKYSYGRGMIPDRIQNELISLPVSNNGCIDWQYMEDYIKLLPYGDCL